MSDHPTGAQQQAITARGNILVVAGAGTGKTSTLVQRCMKLLEDGVSLENILMVTFTEAAAAEMRGRIREALQAKAEMAVQKTTAPAIQPTRAERRPGSEQIEKQIALLDSALICTLHSFCLQLVREHFYELGIDPDISVLDEQQTRPMMHRILDDIFERHYGGTSEADRAVQKLVRNQARGTDDQLRALILKLHRYVQSLADPAGWIAHQRRVFINPEPDCWREWFVSGFTEWRALWLPILKVHSEVPAIRDSIEALECAGSLQGENLGRLTRAATALRRIVAALDDKANWPRGTKTTVGKAVEKFMEEVEFLESVAPADAADAADPLKEDWDLIRHDMLTLLALTEEFGSAFSRAKRELGGVDFADLEQLSLRVLRDASGALTPASMRWRAQLEHVFVDEYQDINAAQDAILVAISREGAASNRFLVGDVKQSIYRFRLADPTIFRSYETVWSSDAHSHRISLTDNFRSRRGVLDFVNALGGSLLRESIGGVGYEPLDFGDPIGRAALGNADHAPRVELHLICRLDADARDSTGEGEATELADLLATEREARLVGMQLKRLKEEQHSIWDKAGKEFRPVEWRDMAVLLRSPSSRVEAFAKEFARLGIPLEAARGGFFESPEISDLVSLLKLLDNPLQDVPLLAVLRSPLVAMSVPELAEIRASEDRTRRAKFFWQAAKRFWSEGRVGFGSEGAPRLSTDSEANSRREYTWRKLNLFFDRLEGWRELVRQSSLSHCLETAMVETHYELLLRAGPRGDQQLANVRRLLELAREYDPYQRQGLFRFLRFIRAQEEATTELEPAAATRDAVQLTSIHRSKGLEFPVVALAGMGARFNERDLTESILLDEQFGLCSTVTPTEGGQRYPSLPFWLAKRRQRRELLGEELRLLYVALTRARDTLVLVGTSGRKGDGCWADEEPAALTDQKVLSARSHLDWLKAWLPHATAAGDWSNDREGRNALLQWALYDENDARLVLTPALPRPARESVIIHHSGANDAAESAKVVARLAWNYPFVAATQQQAKSSVTELRRGQLDEEAAPAKFAPRSGFVLPKPDRLNAADIGTAHHEFLQAVRLATELPKRTLIAEAARLQQTGWLKAEQVRALDFDALEAFWKTKLGREVLDHRGSVEREMPFTARLSADDLAELKLGGANGFGAEEFVVVQGVADLVVVLRNELWLVDFKTDAVTELELPQKVKAYRPQLELYSLALSRIYRRPVTRRALYFLSVRELVEV